MGIKFEKLKPGMTLWTTHRERMGHTTMRRTVATQHVVVSVDPETRMFTTRGTTGLRTRGARDAKKMRASDPTCSNCRRIGGHEFACPLRKSRTKAEAAREEGGA